MSFGAVLFDVLSNICECSLHPVKDVVNGRSYYSSGEMGELPSFCSPLPLSSCVLSVLFCKLADSTGCQFHDPSESCQSCVSPRVRMSGRREDALFGLFGLLFGINWSIWKLPAEGSSTSCLDSSPRLPGLRLKATSFRNWCGCGRQVDVLMGCV